MKFSTTSIIHLIVIASSNHLSSASNEYGIFNQCATGDVLNSLFLPNYGSCVPYGRQIGAASDNASTKPASDAAISGENGWQCYKQGAHAECPFGETMVGWCKSDHDGGQCKDYCPGAGPKDFAVLCAPPPEGKSPVASGKGGWNTPFDKNIPNDNACVTGQVCGWCTGNGSNKECGGGIAQIKCCEVLPFKAVGRWEIAFGLSASKTTYTASYGITKTTTDTKSEEWSSSVTATVEAGLEVEGVGGAKESLSVTASQTISNEYSYSWTMDEEKTFSVEFDSPLDGELAWKWVFDITDNDGNNLTGFSKEYAVTEGADQPPKCVPGYAKDGDNSSYQECIEGYYLPGFSSRRALRGSA